MFPVLYNIHLQIIYFVPSFHKYALSTCNMPTPVWDIWDVLTNETGKDCCPCGVYELCMQGDRQWAVKSRQNEWFICLVCYKVTSTVEGEKEGGREPGEGRRTESRGGQPSGRPGPGWGEGGWLWLEIERRSLSKGLKEGGAPEMPTRREPINTYKYHTYHNLVIECFHHTQEFSRLSTNLPRPGQLWSACSS